MDKREPKIEEDFFYMNKDLTVGSPSKVLWQFCLPMFGSILFQQLYNIADSLVAGKLIGENALAAVGTVLSMVFYRTSIYRQAEEKTTL